jgi:hypothetical protein
LDGGGEDARAAIGDPHSMAATERSIRSYLDGDVALELRSPQELVSPSAGSRTGRNNGQLSLIACSRCLRVLRDAEWVPAELVIRELRAFAYEAPPRFEPVLCPICTFSIQVRRAQARTPLRGAMVLSSGRR